MLNNEHGDLFSNIYHVDFIGQHFKFLQKRKIGTYKMRLRRDDITSNIVLGILTAQKLETFLDEAYIQ
jgi:hypothetical protein